MFLYYAFWELTLVPMAILIAMFGRERGARGSHQVFHLHLPALCLAAGSDCLALRQDRHL